MNIDMTADYRGADSCCWPNVVRAIGQALVFDAAVGDRDGRHRSGECRLRLGACST